MFNSDRQLYGATRKDTLLFSVPWGVTTLTVPVVAPIGTVVVISDLYFSVRSDSTTNSLAVYDAGFLYRVFDNQPVAHATGGVGDSGSRAFSNLCRAVKKPRNSIALEIVGLHLLLKNSLQHDAKPEFKGSRIVR